MAQRSWLYKNSIGLFTEIGLYHGEESGHLLIFVGREILKIDFTVKDENDYHFMLDEEEFRLSFKPDTVKKYELYNESQQMLIPLIGEMDKNPKQKWFMALFIAFLLLIFVMIAIITMRYIP